MQPRDSGRVQDRLIDRLDRKNKQETFKHERFFLFKLPEIHNKLTQTLLIKKVMGM